jgi:hypothetical protein
MAYDELRESDRPDHRKLKQVIVPKLDLAAAR